MLNVDLGHPALPDLGDDHADGGVETPKRYTAFDMQGRHVDRPLIQDEWDQCQGVGDRIAVRADPDRRSEEVRADVNARQTSGKDVGKAHIVVLGEIGQRFRKLVGRPARKGRRRRILVEMIRQTIDGCLADPFAQFGTFRVRSPTVSVGAGIAPRASV